MQLVAPPRPLDLAAARLISAPPPLFLPFPSGPTSGRSTWASTARCSSSGARFPWLRQQGRPGKDAGAHPPRQPTFSPAAHACLASRPGIALAHLCCRPPGIPPSCRGNATITLQHTLGGYPGPLDLVCVQFPDPHFKARHK